MVSDALIDLLRKVSSSFQLRLQEIAAIKVLELAPFQARLLSLIFRHPAISQNALAAATERDKAQIARAIKELERLGFVTRAEHATDWRTQHLTLTEAGRQAAARIDQERTELIATALRDCSAEEQDTLCRSLDKISRSLG